jgi:putative nucleotidyltransferase with HDIG domain
VTWAREHARDLLCAEGNRWTHTRAVADRAELVDAGMSSADRELLVAAAYLHDIGYAPELESTGFHSLDGANHLSDLGYERLANVVANHSAARVEAEARGLGTLMNQYPDFDPQLTAALTYCDMTAAGDGRTVTVDERLADIEERHGKDGAVSDGAREAARMAREFEASMASLGAKAVRRP